MNKEDYSLAVIDFTAVLKLDPLDADAYNNRGTVHEKNGDYDKALADYTKALEINPKLASAKDNLTRVIVIKFIHKAA